MIRLFKNLQIIRMFSKKKKFIFLQKIWGAQAPLVIKWLRHRGQCNIKWLTISPCYTHTVEIHYKFTPFNEISYIEYLLQWCGPQEKVLLKEPSLVTRIHVKCYLLLLTLATLKHTLLDIFNVPNNACALYIAVFFFMPFYRLQFDFTIWCLLIHV